MIKGMMKNLKIAWMTILAKEFVWVGIVLGWFKYLVWKKKVMGGLELMETYDVPIWSINVKENEVKTI
jgi:hypothetical protein